MKKFLALALVLVMLFAFAACGSNNANEDTKAADDSKEDIVVDNDLITSPLPELDIAADFEVPDDFKIGFIFLHDEKSTYDLNFMNAANRAKAILGLSDDQVIFKTPIDESDECTTAAENLAEQGCGIIFADSFGHEPFLRAVAEKYPDIEFCHATGTTAHTAGLKNFHNAFANIFQGRYLAGIAAGLKLNEMIEAGDIKPEEAVIGYVGAFPYAEVKSGYTSFFLGARSVCETATMKVNFTNSWYDVDKERQNALALINDGCVLISQHADSMGAPSACEEKGIPDVSYNGSTYEDCPETFIVSSRIDWTPYFIYIIKSYVEGTEIAADWCGGIEEGSVVLTDINGAVAAEGTADAITEAIAKFKAGDLKVFATDTFTVDGKALDSYQADVDSDDAFTPDTEVIKDGYFAESEYRSAPYFDVDIDGITIQ